MGVIAGIVGNGPRHVMGDLRAFKETSEIDVWIGADRGALTLLSSGFTPDYAIGDFDSVSDDEKQYIQQHAVNYEAFSVEKDWTDLELAVERARSIKPDRLYLFGLGGGRLDHTLINVQMLVKLAGEDIETVMMDGQNQLSASFPGSHRVVYDARYPHISLIPYSQQVTGLTLHGFYYPLDNADISWGSTLCISNKLKEIHGTFSYSNGILLLVKSCDTTG